LFSGADKVLKLGTCSFICEGISTRRQRKDLFDLWVKLPPVTTCRITQRPETSRVTTSKLAGLFRIYPFNAECYKR